MNFSRECIDMGAFIYLFIFDIILISAKLLLCAKKAIAQVKKKSQQSKEYLEE